MSVKKLYYKLEEDLKKYGFKLYYIIDNRIREYFIMDIGASEAVGKHLTISEVEQFIKEQERLMIANPSYKKQRQKIYAKMILEEKIKEKYDTRGKKVYKRKNREEKIIESIIIGVDKDYSNDDCYSFYIGLKTFKALLDNGFVDLSVKETSLSPTIGEFIDFINKYNERVSLHGYIASPDRKDYRVSIVGLLALSEDEIFMEAFKKMFHNANMFNCVKGTQYCYYYEEESPFRLKIKLVSVEEENGAKKLARNEGIKLELKLSEVANFSRVVHILFAK